MTATARKISAQTATPTVLRLGLLADAKVREHITRLGEPVTLGQHESNMFVVADARLGRRMELLVPTGDSYVLRVPDWVEGTLLTKDGMKSLVELRPTAIRKGTTWEYALDDQVRGKLVIGSHKLLFQFVPAPPQGERASASDFRARWYDDEDPLFLALLGSFSVVAASMMAFILTSPRPEPLPDVEAAVALGPIVILRPPVIAPPAAAVEVAPTAPAKPRAAPEPASQPVEEPQDTRAQDEARAKLHVQKLFTEGLSGGGRAPLLEDTSGDDLQTRLNKVGPALAANQGGPVLREGGAGGRGDFKLEVGRVDVGEVKTGGPVKVELQLEHKKPVAKLAAGDPGSIATVVRQYDGRFQSCMEQSLKKDATLDGRISLGWDITGGVVSGVHIVQNSTGNAELGVCFQLAASSMRFGEEASGAVSSYTWTISGQ